MGLYPQVGWDRATALEAGWMDPSDGEDAPWEYADVLADAKTTYGEITREAVPMLAAMAMELVERGGRR